MSNQESNSQQVSKALLNKYFVEPEADKLKGKHNPEGLLLAGKVISIKHTPHVKEVDGVNVYKVQTAIEIESDGRKYQYSSWSNLNEGQEPLDLERDTYYVFSVGGLKSHRVTDGTYKDRNGNERANTVAELTEVRWLEVTELEIRPKGLGAAASSSASAGGAARTKATAA
ncbi:hypothetical protein [Cerasicoccus frondis]|uniref:hypothetical protein n=1 Tax=Cerasicoccus frondis TaxID=490090 RepID=UPI002852A31D|nr:hypothetical protein [Cerasicoccus frondis]